MGGSDYEKFKAMLERLKGTSIFTDIKAGRRRFAAAWSWIDEWNYHEDETGGVRGVEVYLSNWFFQRVIEDRAVLSIDPEYFSLKGGVQRWLYKIARKHCGNNEQWSFSVKALYELYPSGREFRKFKADLKRVVLSDCLPEYHTAWDDAQEMVFFRPRDGMRERRMLPRELRGGTSSVHENNNEHGAEDDAVSGDEMGGEKVTSIEERKQFLLAQATTLQAQEAATK